MEARAIYITEYDAARLRKLLDKASPQERRGNQYLESLEAELARAHILAPAEIPANVITMNSVAHLLDLDTQEEMVYTLVFPDQADPAAGKISVLAPIGTAMLGYRVGDTFLWEVPDGVRRLFVQEVLYQPEASGDYHL